MEKYILKECKKHGLTTFIFENRGYYRCLECRKNRIKQKRLSIKEKLIKHFGGKCSICGYNNYISALEFHHLDPNKKEFKLSSSVIAYNTILLEAEKCILVCGNCHREIHYCNENKK